EVSAVYVMAGDGRFGFQQVVLGRAQGDDILVLAGLSEGDQVALDPVQAAVQVKSVRSGE
ncbi:MAG: efflux transporter periplasmic adaptor subunit, partial [Gammaproteobacteria bacterium]